MVKNKQSGLTLASSVYEAIRMDIIEGRYGSGEKLQFDFLRDTYDVGISPIREALSRLHSDGWVVREEQRGFRVAAIGKSELLELVRTRLLLEGLAIREALANPNEAAEEQLFLAFYRLSKEPRLLSNADGVPSRNLEWEKRHKQFHAALVAGCGLKWIVQYCGQLSDIYERYRLLAVSSYSERKEKDEHRAILDAFVAGDVDQVVALLTKHCQLTVDFILASSFDTDLTVLEA